jgi:hypothetical protein
MTQNADYYLMWDGWMDGCVVWCGVGHVLIIRKARQWQTFQQLSLLLNKRSGWELRFREMDLYADYLFMCKLHHKYLSSIPTIEMH